MTRNSVFLYSYLIILYIRDSGNRVLGLDMVISIHHGSSFDSVVDVCFRGIYTR